MDFICKITVIKIPKKSDKQDKSPIGDSTPHNDTQSRNSDLPPKKRALQDFGEVEYISGSSQDLHSPIFGTTSFIYFT